MIDAIRDWLRACPFIDKKDRFNVNYLGAEPICFTVEEIPNSPIVRRFIDGSTVREKAFVVASRDEYGADVLTNIANSGFWEKFSDWIELQSKTKNFPLMPEGKQPQKIEITASHYLYEAEATTARYQIQIKLTYFQKGER